MIRIPVKGTGLDGLRKITKYFSLRAEISTRDLANTTFGVRLLFILKMNFVDECKSIIYGLVWFGFMSMEFLTARFLPNNCDVRNI